jgi:hypothetical protein
MNQVIDVAAYGGHWEQPRSYGLWRFLIKGIGSCRITYCQMGFSGQCKKQSQLEGPAGAPIVTPYISRASTCRGTASRTKPNGCVINMSTVGR